MQTINRVLDDMALVQTRAKELDVVVVSVLGSIILCYRPRDDSYITWRCTINATDHIGGKAATFISGDYDLTYANAKLNLKDRANFS